MTHAVAIDSCFSLLHSIDRGATELPNLKQAVAEKCGARIRRVDRYIELCLLGALSCVAHRKLPGNTALYLATRCGAVATPSRAMSQIFAEHQHPKPLHFVNTLGNTACFHLSRTLGTCGQTLVISQEQTSFEAALFQAVLDIESGVVETALVGGVDEVTLPVRQQAQRLQSPEAGALLEGSHWLLLCRQSAGTTTLALPEYRQTIEQVRQWLQSQPAAALTLSFRLDATERAVLESSGRRLIEADAATRHNALEHGVYSGASINALLNGDGLPAIHLGKSPTGYCAITVRG